MSDNLAWTFGRALWLQSIPRENCQHTVHTQTCYLADDFRLAGRGRPGSRSAASTMLDIPHMMTSVGDTAFAVAGPRFWNNLPPDIRDPSLSPSIFGKLLKTYLFV